MARSRSQNSWYSKISNKSSRRGRSSSSSGSSSSSSSRGRAPSRAKSISTGPRTKKRKESKTRVWAWWNDKNLDSDVVWKTLHHNGPVFPPPYKRLPSSVSLKYKGRPVKLQSKAEEIATFYAKMLGDKYLNRSKFKKNFFEDWRQAMTAHERSTIRDLKHCDFRAIKDYLKEESQKRKEMSKHEKEKEQKKKDAIAKKFGFCTFDGHKQKIGNFYIEPPGLFRGRGNHPKMGRVKKRVRPEDVIINIGKGARVPRAPHGRWKEVRHDNTVAWLASWTENVMGNVKYIMLNHSSKQKSMKDWMKYKKARQLAKCINRIRGAYNKDLHSSDESVQQRGVAIFFIDKLALRAGNEKDGDKSADTVGCCSLRVEHVRLRKSGTNSIVELNFPGKDSIPYKKSFTVPSLVFKNLKTCQEGKTRKDKLFDLLSTGSLNKHLDTLMPGLSAKVFRTYNASLTLEKQLKEKMKHAANKSVDEKIRIYTSANREVAVLCNHQRAVSKTFDKQMRRLRKRIGDKAKQIHQKESAVKDAKKDGGQRYERLQDGLEKLKEQLKKLKLQEEDKESNKQIALGTSKLNYLDPRISVAWSKRYKVPIDKIYNKAQQEKFRWAIETARANFKFAS